MIEQQTPELQQTPLTAKDGVVARRAQTDVAAKPGHPAEALKTILDVVATALAAERFSEAATASVTALAANLVCDRVSLGIVRHGQIEVKALSHNARFNHKTDLVRTIALAMEEVLDQQAGVVVPPVPGTPVQITFAHEELSRRYGAGALCSFPLRAHGRIIGVLTFERGSLQPFDQHALALCEAVGALAGPVFELKRREDRWILAKAVDAGRDHLTALIGPGHLTFKVLFVLIAGLVTFLCLATGDFRLTAKAVLEGQVQQAAVAPFQGYVDTAPARAGDVVQGGQVLATLQDHELRLERLKRLSEREELTKEYRQALAERNAPKVQITTAKLGQVEAELARASDKLSRTRVVAPFDGVVVIGDLSQQLGSPVEIGKVLFEVARLNAYRIVLQVDERDISAVAVGQTGHLLLSAVPGETFPFRVTSITPVATARDGRNFFRVEASFPATPRDLRPAMEGVGKIEVDQRRLIWIWSHEALDWVRLKLWAWLP